MKGIVLAGGNGTRLYPLTFTENKHLLPIYNKPMIYYSISVLILAKIKDIMIITSQEYINDFKKIFKDGTEFGLKISYGIQDAPKGIPEAFKIAKNFIKNDKVCLILGDNIFYGQYFFKTLNYAKKSSKGSTVFSYKVNNPKDFAVLEFTNKNKIKRIEEKPTYPKSNEVITGLYFFDNSVIKKFNNITIGKRGEYEIVDILNQYLKNNELKNISLGRGFAWLDTGNFKNLYEASQFVKTIEERQGFMIACIEEICFRNDWINRAQLINLSKKYKKSEYAKYLLKIADEKTIK